MDIYGNLTVESDKWRNIGYHLRVALKTNSAREDDSMRRSAGIRPVGFLQQEERPQRFVLFLHTRYSVSLLKINC